MDEIEVAELRARLKAAIDMRGIPVDRLAREAKVDRQTLRGFLNGLRERRGGLSLPTVRRLARVLQVKAGELAFGEEDEETEEVCPQAVAA